jgi:hypothetical protein
LQLRRGKGGDRLVTQFEEFNPQFAGLSCGSLYLPAIQKADSGGLIGLEKGAD